jgi:tetratricopeptide (TPR) repeat protein
VARGTQHRKRRPAPHARAAAVAAPARKKQKAPQWQEQLFFQRLRLHAKWAYVGLVVAFVFGFVLLGVGSGSGGIGDVLQNAFNFGSSGGTSISKLQKKVNAQPKDAAAWRDLATAYETKQRTQDAIDALSRFTALRPKNQDALEELAAQYGNLADKYATDYTNVQNQAALVTPSSIFTPASTTPLGKAFQDSKALQDPISQVVQSEASTKESTAYSGYQAAQQNAERTYKKLAALSPADASTQLSLGNAASAVQDYKTAVAAYKKFLKLAPTDIEAPRVKKLLKQAEASSKAGAATAAGG